jgi:hypothetical protein
MKKTEEQLENTDVFRTGADLVIEAGAGCGKTSQLVMLGQTPDAGRGVMIAFNKAVAVEAQSKFPSNVSCSTAHSLAFRAVVSRPCVQRLGGPPVQAKSLAEDFLGIRSWFNDVPKGRKADLVMEDRLPGRADGAPVLLLRRRRGAALARALGRGHHRRAREVIAQAGAAVRPRDLGRPAEGPGASPASSTTTT